MQFCNRFDFAVLAFLQLRREYILEPVRLVERKRHRLIVRINHEITAARLIVRIDEPLLNVVKKFTTDSPVLEGITHPKTPDENRRINQVAFFPCKSLANQFFPSIREIIREYACIRDSKRADNIPKRTRVDKRIRLPHQLTAVINGIILEKRIKILVATGETFAAVQNR